MPIQEYFNNNTLWQPMRIFNLLFVKLFLFEKSLRTNKHTAVQGE